MADDRDDRMHDLLTHAGERWRERHVANQDAAPARGRVRRRRSPALLASAAVLVAVLVAGGVEVAIETHDSTSTLGPSSALPAALTGTTWHLVAVTAGRGALRNGLPTDVEATLRFRDGRAQMTTLCGGFTYRAAAGRDSLSLTDEQQQDHSCPAITSATQLVSGTILDAVTAVIDGTTSWRIAAGHQLTMVRRGAGSVTFFDADAGLANRALTGRTWRLETAIDADQHEYPATGQSLRVSPPTVVADDGANGLSGRVTVAAGALRFDAMSATQVAGEHPETQKLVDDVLLSGGCSYGIVGDALFLERAGVTLIYRADG